MPENFEEFALPESQSEERWRLKWFLASNSFQGSRRAKRTLISTHPVSIVLVVSRPGVPADEGIYLDLLVLAAFGPVVLAAGQKQAVVPSKGAKQGCQAGALSRRPPNRGGPPDGWARHDPLLPGE